MNIKLVKHIGSPVATVGFNHKIIPIQTKDTEIKLDVFDTAGTEQFNAINDIITRNCTIFIFMYSCEKDNPNNGFDQVEYYYNKVKEESNIDLTFIVQNKIDNIDIKNREEAGEKGSEWCKCHSAHFHQVSCLNGEGVNELFDFIAESAIFFILMLFKQIDDSDFIALRYFQYMFYLIFYRFSDLLKS